MYVLKYFKIRKDLSGKVRVKLFKESIFQVSVGIQRVCAMPAGLVFERVDAEEQCG